MKNKVSLKNADGSWNFKQDPMFKRYSHLIDEVIDEGPKRGIFEKPYPNDWWCYLSNGITVDGSSTIHEPTRRRVIEQLKRVKFISWKPQEIPKNWPKAVKEAINYIDTDGNSNFIYQIHGCDDDFRAESLTQILRDVKEMSLETA